MRAWLSIIFVGVLIGILANEVGPPIVGCGIKGNLSYNTGERIYHVRGQILLADENQLAQRRALVLFRRGRSQSGVAQG